METISDSVNAEGPEFKNRWVVSLLSNLFHVDILRLKSHDISVILGDKSSNLSSRQKHINVLKEILSLDLIVSQNEGNRVSFRSCLIVLVSDVILQLSLSVRLCQGNLEVNLFTDEGSKFSKGLLS